MNLFQFGDFTLASGASSRWKIKCDALTNNDWDALAAMLVEHLPRKFGQVIGVPRGGIPFEKALEPYANPNVRRVLVVDDVWTTGGSMKAFIEKHQELQAMYGMGYLDRAVVFARNMPPPSVVPLFQMPPKQA